MESDDGKESLNNIDEEEEFCGIKAAYSMSDMLDALSDTDEDEFVEAETGEDSTENKDESSKATKENETSDLSDLATSNVSNKTSLHPATSVKSEPQTSNAEITESKKNPGTEVLDKSTNNMTSSSTENKAQVKSDISGRFHVDEEVYENDSDVQSNKTVAQDESKTDLKVVGSYVQSENIENLGEDEIQHDYDELDLVVRPRTVGTLREPQYANIYEGMEGDTLKNVIYENVSFVNKGSYGADSQATVGTPDDFEDDGWSSSEFESYENTPVGTLEGEEQDGGAGAQSLQNSGKDSEASIRRKKKKRAAHQHLQEIRNSIKSPRSTDIQQMFTRLGDRLGDKIELIGQRLSKQDTEEAEGEEDSPVLMDISLNMEKHPPAELPDVPCGLNALQLKRRHILSSLVESEKNYLESLNRIVEDYEKPLQEVKPHILAKQTIKIIFHKVRDILQCHNMFHIELSEAVKTWDEEERIGNAFIASFSKSMVFESYSAYVNNFSLAMETTKRQARSRPAFAEFLKQKLETSSDKLSLFGLMVKPVQRFPQFILIMQDLLKHTPHDHHDRIPLQMALTELENLTQKLNETKRESESRYDAKRVVSSIIGLKNPIKSDDSRYLVRQDDVITIESVNGESKTKRRRIYVMNDLVLCVSVDTKSSSAGERYKHKWHVPVTEIQVSDQSVIHCYQVKSAQGRTSITPIKTDKFDVAGAPINPYKEEIDDMLHDLPIVEHIGQLIIQLRMKYEGLNSSVINGLMRSLQVNIQQKSDMDKYIVHLYMPSNNNKEGKRFAFQLDTPTRRRDWLFELQNTKLSHDPNNKPGWLIPENERMFNAKMPLFLKPMLIDVTQHDTRGSKKKKFKYKVECAVPVLLPSPELPGVGIQHLWVCSGDRGKGHVTIVSFHGNKPQVIESFKSCDSPILCAELVPGYACCDDDMAFVQDTVWMALENQSIHIRDVAEDERKSAEVSVEVGSTITCMKYLDSKLYVGLDTGKLLVYSRDQDGIWQTGCKEVIELDKDEQAVTDLLAVDHHLLVACGRFVWELNVLTHYQASGAVKLEITKKCHSVSHAGETFVESVIKAGAGLVVSFRGSSLLRLYHLETMEHLQDINVASVLADLMDAKKKLDSNMRESFRRIHITYLMACKGLLWIGTSVGCVLTLPLPRLEGVPQIKGRPFVSYHAHVGAVKFLASVYCGASQLNKNELEDSIVSDICQQSEVSSKLSNSGAHSSYQAEAHSKTEGVILSLGGVTESETDDFRGFTKSDEVTIRRPVDEFGLLDLPQSFGGGGTGTMGNLAGSKNLWASTPDLRASNVVTQTSVEDVNALYGSLLRFPQEDYDAELLGVKQNNGAVSGGAKVKLHNIPGYNLVSKKATAVNAKITQMIKQQQQDAPLSPQSKYATLPVLRDDSVPPSSSSGGTPDVKRNSIILDDISTASSCTSEKDQFLAMSHQTSTQNNKNSSNGSENSLSSAAMCQENVSVLNTSNQVEAGDQNQSIKLVSENVTGEGQSNANHSKKLFISQSAPIAMLNDSVLGKSHMVISGGDGYINWSDAKAINLKYEDICLLLWKYRQ